MKGRVPLVVSGDMHANALGTAPRSGARSASRGARDISGGNFFQCQTVANALVDDAT